MEKQTLV